MGKGSALEEAKQRLRDKLKDIEHQAGSLHAVIDDTTKEVLCKIFLSMGSFNSKAFSNPHIRILSNKQK